MPMRMTEPIVALAYTTWRNRQRKQGKKKQANTYFRWYICKREVRIANVLEEFEVIQLLGKDYLQKEIRVQKQVSA